MTGSVELNSDGELEETLIVSKYPKYNPSKMKVDYLWKKGFEFMSINQFKEAIRKYSLLNGYDVKFRINDSSMCRAKHRSEGCNFVIFVSKVRGSKSFRLETLYPKHTCVKTFKGHLASSDWFVEKNT